MAEYEELRRKVIASCNTMNRVGLNEGRSGNISVRNDEGFLISASGVAYDAMTQDQVVQMDLQGTYSGPVLPSSEWRMHLDLYRTHPDAEAVVHTHSPHATALSCLREDVPAFHYMIGVTGGASLRCARYARFGTPELSEAMLLAIEGRKACLLANHGLICFSESLDKAMDLAISVEGLCRQYILARQCGTPVVLSDTEMGEVLERFGSYGKQAEDMAENEIPAFDLPVQRDI